MRNTTHRLIWPLLALAALAPVQRVAAQGRNQLAPGPALTKRVPTLPPVAAGIPWPRLDVGAIFCRTQDDLRRRAEMVTARGSGQTPPTGPVPACRLIGSLTPIDVLGRPSPAATEVRLRPRQTAGTTNLEDAETGWTDAWLPEKAPR